MMQCGVSQKNIKYVSYKTATRNIRLQTDWMRKISSLE